MTTLRCSSPSHAGRSAQPDWSNNLGTADHQVDGMKCGACARLDGPDAQAVNVDTLRQHGLAFLANPTPSNAQVVKAVKALMRLQLGQLDDVSDT